MSGHSWARDHARELRRNLTDSGRLLWARLCQRQLGGFRFRRQHPMGRYILDFVCLELRYIVELDGDQHARPDHQVTDEDRSRWLEEQGYVIRRFWNQEVYKEMDRVLETIGLDLTSGIRGQIEVERSVRRENPPHTRNSSTDARLKGLPPSSIANDDANNSRLEALSTSNLAEELANDSGVAALTTSPLAGEVASNASGWGGGSTSRFSQLVLSPKDAGRAPTHVPIARRRVSNARIPMEREAQELNQLARKEGRSS
jgi:very-short-patch-repair endonuclease